MIIKTESTIYGIKVTYERDGGKEYEVYFSFNDDGFNFSTSFVKIDKIEKQAANVAKVDVVRN